MGNVSFFLVGGLHPQIVGSSSKTSCRHFDIVSFIILDLLLVWYYNPRRSMVLNGFSRETSVTASSSMAQFLSRHTNLTSLAQLLFLTVV